MTETRKRQIGRGAVVAVSIVVLLLVVVATREIELRRSRAIKLGMTKGQVTAVMGHPYAEWFAEAGNPPGHLFGVFAGVKYRFCVWIGAATDPDVDEFPVCVHFDKNGLVDRIVRGSEVEESSVIRADRPRDED